MKSFPGIVIDDTQAKLTGPWKKSTISAGIHQGYQHDGDKRDGSCTAIFATNLESGEYQILVAYTANPNRTTNVPVTLQAGREVHR